MRSRLILPFLLFFASFCKAQTDATPTTPAAASPAEEVAGAISADLLSDISAAKKVPPACVTQILSAPGQTLSFRTNAFCATYLAMSSQQYRAFTDRSRNTVTKTLLADPAIQAAAIQALKSLSQQTGSSTGTGGSTNLTAKGLASQFLSLASEYGALTESTSGQTTTLAGTLAGVPLVLLKEGLLQSCPTNLYGLLGKDEGCASPKVIDTLNRISYSVGINSNTGNQAQSATVSTTSNGPAVPAVFGNSGSSLSVSAVSAKWVALQGKPSSDAVAAGYERIMQNGVMKDTREVATTLQLLEPNGEVTEDFRTKTAEAITDYLKDKPKPYSKAVVEVALEKWKGSADQFVESFVKSRTLSPDEAAQSDFLLAVQKFAVGYAKVIGQEQAIGLAIARPAILTFEYDNNRPLNQPSNSVFRVIYQAKLGQVTLTANGAASIYDSEPSSSIPGAQRLRDVQIAAQADRPFSLGVAGKKIDMTGSGSFYFQDQTSPAILNVTPGMPVSGVSFTGLPSTATQVFAQKGNIAVGQAKITIGSGSNLKVPISVTYSNRTELVTSPTWRGQIGISYDFDSLFTKK